jgi:uncharacterized protein YndB with AHSA1/START domain
MPCKCMREFAANSEISAPVEGVWTVLADVERWPRWTASLGSKSNELRSHRSSTGRLPVGVDTSRPIDYLLVVSILLW